MEASQESQALGMNRKEWAQAQIVKKKAKNGPKIAQKRVKVGKNWLKWGIFLKKFFFCDFSK